MKRFTAFLLAALMILSLSACKNEEPQEEPVSSSGQSESEESIEAVKPQIPMEDYGEAVKIELGESITIDGQPAGKSDSVTVGGEIVYYKDLNSYESGYPYGEGAKADKHTAEEAAEHTLVTITKPGEYFISGSLKGQIAVDLGENAKTDPNARVKLVLGNADITCEIAPAIIFYNVYECETGENPTETVDTAYAGANVVIADESINNIKGSYVARIFKDNENREKLHKYDGALYSKMSMNVDGGEKGTGTLFIEAENEGLDSEMHLTINGGIIDITAQNDGINTNEDGVSVTTVNGGSLHINAGLGSEGDGIDSNGWLVINGGKVVAYGNLAADGGLDSDKGIIINGGNVAAYGGRSDAITVGQNQTAVQLNFASVKTAGSKIEFTDPTGQGVTVLKCERDFRTAVFAGEGLEKDKGYSLYVDGVLQEYSGEGAVFEEIPQVSTGETFPGRQNPFEAPEGFEAWLNGAKDVPDEIREWLETFEEKEAPKPEPAPTEDTHGEGSGIGLKPQQEKSTSFVITEENYVFSDIRNSEEAAGKENVKFIVNKGSKIDDIYVKSNGEIESIECEKEVPAEDVQIVIEYIGKDDSVKVTKTCLLSEGYRKINSLFASLPVGKYRFTVEVAEQNGEYMGQTVFHFEVFD